MLFRLLALFMYILPTLQLSINHNDRNKEIILGCNNPVEGDNYLYSYDKREQVINEYKIEMDSDIINKLNTYSLSQLSIEDSLWKVKVVNDQNKLLLSNNLILRLQGDDINIKTLDNEIDWVLDTKFNDKEQMSIYGMLKSNSSLIQLDLKSLQINVIDGVSLDSHLGYSIIKQGNSKLIINNNIDQQLLILDSDNLLTYINNSNFTLWNINTFEATTLNLTLSNYQPKESLCYFNKHENLTTLNLNIKTNLNLITNEKQITTISIPTITPSPPSSKNDQLILILSIILSLIITIAIIVTVIICTIRSHRKVYEARIGVEKPCYNDLDSKKKKGSISYCEWNAPDPFRVVDITFPSQVANRRVTE
ncbi:hypothetical protein K502DRAFT_322913 [Neoconidiobolus thromboides FSU 785]|nr:hypothetical protein K502DRAFT_322913 [Neoconidiobolus thromboides FSU 785]